MHYRTLPEQTLLLPSPCTACTLAVGHEHPFGQRSTYVCTYACIYACMLCVRGKRRTLRHSRWYLRISRRHCTTAAAWRASSSSQAFTPTTFDARCYGVCRCVHVSLVLHTSTHHPPTHPTTHTQTHTRTRNEREREREREREKEKERDASTHNHAHTDTQSTHAHIEV